MGKLKENSDYIIYIHRTPDQREANLANAIIRDMKNGNRFNFRDIIFNPSVNCRMHPFYIIIESCFNWLGVNMCEERKKVHEVIVNIEENTSKYITKFVTTEFDKKYKLIDVWDECEGGGIFPDNSVNWDEVAKALKKLSYDEFLLTFYWDIIKRRMRGLADNRCRVCNSDSLLNVHHRTYEHHGYEIQNLNDLTVLCEECHTLYYEAGKILKLK